MKVYRDLVEDGVLVSKEIFDIAECTYTGKDMGERSITATIEFATPIDFQIGDYIKLPMQNLIRSTSGVNGSIASGSDEVEKFYIYTMPTIKKVARAMSNGKAFEHNVTFQSAQYELSCVQMRDLGNSMNADSVIYTGFDNVTFNGAAHELMERIMMVLKEAYHDSEGNPLWSYEISDTVNEDVNLALERFPISFSGNTVMDALLELNNKETINTTFFINNRKIYVGFKRPYFCRVTDGMSIDTNPSSQLFTFQYGKTSDKGVALQYGGLYDITKTVGREVPITKLFAYGASRNLNRYYCSDRVKGGRYVNRLMLPSFDADGKTDFIISEDALQRYGVREATKQFEEIYPSIRYATYGDIRQVKYCIKVKASGRSEDIDQSSYPIARIQCYKVVEGEITGVNKLVEAAPPDDLAIYIHSMDKTVKVVLYGGATDEEAIAKQKAHDTHVPSRVYSGAIPGSCFIVHDRGFDEEGTVYENLDRSAWFTSLEDLSGFTEKQKEEIKLNQINYTDTFWLTDLYIFQNYEQTYFSRDGYSAWSWARLNNKYSSEKGHIASDSVVVNEIVHVEPITISDTNMTADGIDKRQSTFDIYLRDLGFTINEQNDFGDMVFLQNGTVKVSILDGLLAGQEFEISGSINSTSPSCICAFNDDGTRNEAFFEEPDYTTDGTNPQTPYDAFEKGAIWRIRLNRTNVDEADYANLNLAMPTKEINAKQGDHLVLLDIFMPDIYIHAAENRLLREARKYLEANDNGSISYAVNFDKVRMQQIPNYALQMREGLNLRVVDEDLNIRTENNGRYIADYRDNKVFSSTESDHNRVWLSANTPIDFTRGKYYTIEFELYDDSSFDTSATNAFALLKTKNDATIAFNPSYSVNKAYLDNGKIAITIKFNLPDNFDDSSIYYPSLLLVSEISSNMRMYSHWLSYVFERDFDENTNILNYADFTIDSLTIKITDNSGNNEPIREITATLSEQTNATAWATLMNKVATTAKEGAQNKKAIEEVVNTARKNYQALLSLKDSIFDPDGSCDQVFLQVMMQQVGADSMNYQLDNTRSGLGSDGQPTLFNCSCERGGDGYYHFKVYNNDTLRHYVYTQGSQAGNWEIPVGATGVDVQLNGTESYFVCLKCPKNDTVGQWICSTKQYAVNDPEDDTCWFFNWAILTVDSGGVYTLQETRGNAYMYGDNLVCGKISTMAGNSYFDLTHGNFVLGDGTGPALSYINGVLTISGSKGDAEETLRQLGILSEDVSGLESGLSAEEQARQAAIAAEQAARQAAIQAIQAEVAAVEEKRLKDVAKLEGVQNSLQAQIDGEVTSWFYDKAPVDTSDNILTNVEPMSEWLKNYTYANGVYTLNSGARNDLVNHIGDTYTNMEEYKADDQGNTTTPLAGLSWRWCDATSVSPLPSKYITIKYKDNNGSDVTKKLHWHKIADSDAVKALQEAGKAQATADGKSTIFSLTGTNKPTNYQKGDMWVLQSDTIHPAGKKGDILNANQDSATYAESHWTKEVSYIDEDVAIQQAKNAVDNLEFGGRNLLTNSELKYNITGYSAERGTLTLVNGEYTRLTTNSDNNYHILYLTNSVKTTVTRITECDNLIFSFMMRCSNTTDTMYIQFAAKDANGTVKYLTTTHFKAKDSEWNKVEISLNGNMREWFKSNNLIPSTVSLYFVSNAENTTIDLYNLKLEQGNKATDWTCAPEDVEAEIVAADNKAKDAQDSAKKANDQLDAIDNDSKIARSEKATIETQLEQVMAEYSDIVADAGKYSVSTSAYKTAYDNAVAALHYHCGKTYNSVTPTINTDGSITIVTDTSKAYCYSNISAYYTARQTILTAITDATKTYAENVAIQQAKNAVENLEIGTRNLWAKKYMMDWNNTHADVATKGTDDYGEYISVQEGNLYGYIGNYTSYNDILQGKVNFETGKQYCLKVKWRTPIDNAQWGGLYLTFNYSDGTRSDYILCEANSTTPHIDTLISQSGKDVTGISSTYGSTNRTRIYDIMLVQATKQPNDWLVAPEDVDYAIANIEVGGVNLLNNSKVKKLGDWLGDGANVTFDKSDNSIKGVSNGNYPRIKNTSVKDIGFVAGKHYTISMEVKANAAATRSAYIGNNSSSVIALSFGSFAVTTSWNRVSLTALCQAHDPSVAAFALYIYCGTSKKNDASEYLQIRNIKIEEGKVATAWSPSVADTEAEIRAAESKAEALGYLTAVLEDSENTTDITGGLVMTNVLMLKDLANAGGSVNAGMSGVNSDNVLLWGGGTYEDAVHAKDNDFEKLNGSDITTLLKKDGTGKIGIFKISDTQAIVDVPNQGKVIIDASTTNGGIRILNSQGRINAALLPTSISQYKPKTDTTTSSSGKVYYAAMDNTVTLSSSNFLQSSFTLRRSDGSYPTGNTTKDFDSHTEKITISSAVSDKTLQSISISGTIKRSLITETGGNTTGEMLVTIKVSIMYGNTEIGYTSLTEIIDGSNTQTSFDRTINITKRNNPTSLNDSTPLTVKVSASANSGSVGSLTSVNNMKLKQTSTNYITYTKTTTTSYTYPPQTIIGSDGLISLVSNSKYFMVDNTGSMQKIYVKGLSTTKGSTAGSGELYISNYSNEGLVKTLYDGFAAISEVLEKCKYEGSNAKAQENAKNACTDIRTALSQISIIANT